MESMIRPIRRYADFRGRSRRSEYWLFALFVFLVQCAAYLLIGLAGGSWDPDASDISPVGLIVELALGLFMIFLIVPSLAVAFRRLHDINRSAWWLLIALIPVFGGIVLFIFNVLDGTPGDNRFGPDPKARALDPLVA